MLGRRRFAGQQELSIADRRSESAAGVDPRTAPVPAAPTTRAAAPAAPNDRLVERAIRPTNHWPPDPD
jgi:hypothetical protein